MPDLLWRVWRSLGLYCLVFVGGLALSGCGGSESGGPGEGPGRRYQALSLSAQQEVQLGDEAFQEVLQKEHPVNGAAETRVRDGR